MRESWVVLSMAALAVGSGALGAQGQPAAAAAPQMQLPSVYLEELTWTEVRDALAAGYRTVIIPTGGTEQNGDHMVMGKHNYLSSYVAGMAARRLGNALVAPVIAFVPEGNFNSANFQAGVISAGASFQPLMEAAARSLKVHGFTDILIVGDNGGNQGGIRAVTTKLNTEWAGSGTTVYGLTDYYDQGQEMSRMWLEAEYGYDRGTIGSHAGITDTSAMMYAVPSGIRRQLISAEGEGQSGNPMLADSHIGRMVVNFKMLATLRQYEQLKTAEARAAGGGGGGGGGGGRGGGAGGGPGGN